MNLRYKQQAMLRHVSLKFFQMQGLFHVFPAFDVEYPVVLGKLMSFRHVWYFNEHM